MRGHRKQKKGTKEGGDGAWEKTAAVDSGICVTRGAREPGLWARRAQISCRLQPSPSRLLPPFAKGPGGAVGRVRTRARVSVQSRVCTGQRRASGVGGLVPGTPLRGTARPVQTRLQPPLQLPSPSQGWRPRRSPRLLSGCAEHKALSPSRSLFSAAPDPPKRRICT